MTLRVLIGSSARDAVGLYFQPLTRIWRRNVADYRDLAARDFLWELHDLATAITDGRITDAVRPDVTEILRRAEDVLDSRVARALELVELARVLENTVSRQPDHRLAVHASFVAGYIAGVLARAPLPSSHVRSASTFYECHDALVMLMKRIRPRPSKRFIA